MYVQIIRYINQMIFNSVKQYNLQKVSVKSIQLLSITKMNKMQRLFGKELSNFVQPSANIKIKQIGRIHSQSTKNNSEDQSRVLIKRFNRSNAGQNHLEKVPKSQQNVSLHIELNQQQKDVQLVKQYFDDCFRYMIQQETKNYKLKNYFTQQNEINEKMRGILLQWIIELHHKFKMFPQTLYATVMIIDYYLLKNKVNKENLQLVGTAAFYLASKYEETYQVPQVSDLVHYAAKAFTKQQIIKMEAEIIQTLDFNLIMQTSFRFFEPLTKICKMQLKNFHLAQYILQLSLLQTKFLEYKPSLLASSSIYLINKIRKRPESWTHELEQITGYEQKQLKTCAKQLCYLLQIADQLPNTKSLKKKFSLPQYNQVTRIKLQRKKL